WSKNVKGYGSLFHRIVGPVDQLLDYARRQGQGWFRGKTGSEQHNWEVSGVSGIPRLLDASLCV
ncbi:MAG: hypothetical protein ACI81V_001166, partial [Lentimonas sp.]